MQPRTISRVVARQNGRRRKDQSRTYESRFVIDYRRRHLMPRAARAALMPAEIRARWASLRFCPRMATAIFARVSGRIGVCLRTRDILARCAADLGLPIAAADILARVAAECLNP